MKASTIRSKISTVLGRFALTAVVCVPAVTMAAKRVPDRAPYQLVEMFGPTAREIAAQVSATLDTLFDFDHAPKEYTFVIRFRPSRAPESEIVFRSMKGVADAIETTANTNVDTALRQSVAATLAASPRDLAKRFTAKRRTLVLPKGRSEQWQKEFFDLLKSHVDTLARRDTSLPSGSTTYELRYQTLFSVTELHLIDADPGSSETGDSPLVRWMNRVRLAVANSK